MPKYRVASDGVAFDQTGERFTRGDIIDKPRLPSGARWLVDDGHLVPLDDDDEPEDD